MNNKVTQSYGFAYRDAHSAYEQAVLYHITGNGSFASATVQTLDGWACNSKESCRRDV